MRVTLLEEETNRRIYVEENDIELIDSLMDWYENANREDASTFSYFSIRHVKNDIFVIQVKQKEDYNFPDDIVLETAVDPDDDGNFPFVYKNKSYIPCGSIKKNVILHSNQ
jgi:hypothetical protein